MRAAHTTCESIPEHCAGEHQTRHRTTHPEDQTRPEAAPTPTLPHHQPTTQHQTNRTPPTTADTCHTETHPPRPHPPPPHASTPANQQPPTPTPFRTRHTTSPQTMPTPRYSQTPPPPTHTFQLRPRENPKTSQTRDGQQQTPPEPTGHTHRINPARPQTTAPTTQHPPHPRQTTNTLTA